MTATDERERTMPTISYTSAQGETRILTAAVGDTVMQTAVRSGVAGIVGECGGVLSCATCHVYVDEDDLPRLPEMTDLEDEMLEGTAEDRRPNSRLSCQISITETLGDVHVTTPEFQE
jgi:2Fe-2S ferredoxin